MSLIRLFIVDDHAVLRQGLRLLLSSQPGLRVVGETGSGEYLLVQLAQTPADVVLLDLCLPGLPGAEVLRRLQQQHPQVRVLVLSSLADPAQVAALFDAGARGYAVKSVGSAELVHGIRRVAAGRPYLCTELGVVALRRVHERTARGAAGATAPAAAGAPSQPLTNREREVLQLVAEGLTSEAIAGRLLTSKRTVETHRQHLMAKTQVKNTAALVKLANRQGWLP